ncbi:Mitochondrial inner membrane protease ATP23 [Orchesella cincta]|uniref:Mitochondrial inner membrane protease ATP23 n=1 Tax=Orchesella cincta TaxID=48709 RepID=A0A1D2M9J5_ORCCI|nr:Mitochondrial inner membrane protease ATP23 [Orchesella cincta]
MPFWKADCSESVEEALARLDLESKRNKAEKLAKLEAEKAAKAQINMTGTGNSKEEACYGDPLSLESDKERELSLNEKARKLYPERGGDPYKPSWFNVLIKGEGREGLDKMKCEMKVWKVVQQSYLVRLLMDALKSSGCEIDIRRHISCEVCDVSVTGGYDPTLNQVVICQNTARYKGIIQGALTHELIHMFDNCRHKLDFKNIQHLACTEIRAANLAHCSYMSGLTDGSLSFGSVKEQHQECVKERAVRSVLAVRDVSHEEARDVVDSVFEKCYNDLEPIGRRIRRNSDHMQKAYWERKSMGYDLSNKNV